MKRSAAQLEGSESNQQLRQLSQVRLLQACCSQEWAQGLVIKSWFWDYVYQCSVRGMSFLEAPTGETAAAQ